MSATHQQPMFDPVKTTLVERACIRLTAYGSFDNYDSIYGGLEGGNDTALASSILLLRNNGWAILTERRQRERGSNPALCTYWLVRAGTAPKDPFFDREAKADPSRYPMYHPAPEVTFPLGDATTLIAFGGGAAVLVTVAGPLYNPILPGSRIAAPVHADAGLSAGRRLYAIGTPALVRALQSEAAKNRAEAMK